MARVVIVEDDEAFLYVVERELQAAGHEAVPFANWLGVLELLETDEVVDVLVTDLRLPEGTPNGLSLARMAITRRPGLKVVYMTAFAALADEIRRTLPGVIIKGGDATEVVRAVETSVAAA